MGEIPSFINPKTVGGENPYSQLLEKGISREHIKAVHDKFGLIVGTTAIHGYEPGQISINTGLQVNNTFMRKGLSPIPIVVPYVPGDDVYGSRMLRVYHDVYSPGEQRQVFLSEDLGHALLETQFGRGGYQRHLLNVRDNIGSVHRGLGALLDGPFEVHNLLAPSQSRLVDPTVRSILEINAGANASLANVSDRVEAYGAFPVTFDGLIKFIQKNNDFFEYGDRLLQRVLGIATDMSQDLNAVILPDLHTLGEESWFEREYPESFITPPWKRRLDPPDVSIDIRERTITIDTNNRETKPVTGYRPDKGVVYVNVSGNDMGSQAAQAFVYAAQDDGYVVAAPGWLRDQWIAQEKDEKSRSALENVLASGPNILFAKYDGEPLCKAFFMRLGMGSYAYAQLAGVPIIYLGFDTIDNPEMVGNSAVVRKNGLGIRYTGDEDTMQKVRELSTNYLPFNNVVYQRYGISRDVDGLSAVANIILLDQVNRMN